MRVYVLSAIGLGLVAVVALAWPTTSAPPRRAHAVETSAARVVESKSTKHMLPMPMPSELPPDVAARWSSIEAMVRDGDLAELPALERTELAQEPEAAPAIIHGLASLAVQGSDADRALAGKTLVRWLHDEKKRDTRDAVGNVVNIVEALGDLGGDDAVTALIDVLDHDDDLALQTTACDRLATLGDARALPAVARFAERLARTSEPTDDFEKELRAEALKTVADARARLERKE